VDALAGEAALDPELLRLGVANGDFGDVGDCHVRAPLESREVRAARECPKKKEKEPLANGRGSERPTGHMTLLLPSLS
jgi:hypothetical protein